MATLSAAGIGSGLDVAGIVSSLMAVERKPIELLATKTTDIKTQLSAYGKLNSAIAAFRDASSALTKADMWAATTSTSADPTSVSVASGTAAPGSYAIQVAKLASVQSIATQTLPADTAMGAGTLHIELGAYNTDQTSFTAKAGATAIDVEIVEGEDTLAKVAAKINNASAGVTASIVSDISGSRLVLRSTATGAENGFRVSSTGAAGSGLAGVAFDPTAGATTMTQTQRASNALATVNGLSIESASNTLTGAVEGLSIKLSKVTTDPIDVTVTQDDASIKTKLQAFADAYNSLNNLMVTQLKYDEGTKTAGPLQGDRTAVALQAQFRQLIGGVSGASSKFTRLSDIGMEIQKDGSLLLNSTKVTAALANVTEVKKMFGNVDASDPLVPGNDGFAQRLRSLGDAVLGVEGAITMRSTGLQSQINRNDKREDELEERVARTEVRIKAQYSLLDTKLTTLNGLSTFMTNQLAALANNS